MEAAGLGASAVWRRRWRRCRRRRGNGRRVSRAALRSSPASRGPPCAPPRRVVGRPALLLRVSWAALRSSPTSQRLGLRVSLAGAVASLGGLAMSSRLATPFCTRFLLRFPSPAQKVSFNYSSVFLLFEKQFALFETEECQKKKKEFNLQVIF